MAKVTLISYTGIGHPDPLYAAKLLAYTKNTRLNMTPTGLSEVLNWPEDRVLAEMEYMSGSIPSSWEFADLIFSVNNLSRATAQQMTRTRHASFAMQSQRVTDLRAVTWDGVGNVSSEVGVDFDKRMERAIKAYTDMIEDGLSLEDARDLLPIGVHCNLVGKYNLRTLVELCRARDSLRVQGPYHDIVVQMRSEVLAIWPWASTFFEPPNLKAIRMIEQIALELKEKPGAMYQGAAGTLAKAADLLKK